MNYDREQEEVGAATETLEALKGVRPFRDGVPCIAWDGRRGLFVDMVTGRTAADSLDLVGNLGGTSGGVEK